MKSKYLRLIIEAVAWTIFMGFPIFFLPSLLEYFGVEKLRTVVQGVLMTHACLIGFYYFNYFFALPRYYFQRKYGLYYLQVGVFLLVLLLLMNDNAYNPLESERFVNSRIVFVFSIIIRFLMVFLLSLGLSSYNRYRLAEEAKIKSELSFLKAQINPHFLFNTLNSIYALTVRKSENAPESVTRLASIMRYVITEASADFVPLEKEIRYVSDYVDLERLRLTDKVRLEYLVKGESAGLQIAPLIFIPLIENAFKHGVSTSEPSHIKIEIALGNGRLELNVNNTKVKTEKKSSNGLGIENMRKRLDLLYSGKHNLQIKDSISEFSANLVLHLK